LTLTNIYISPASSIIFDFIYAIYPATVFWKMRLENARKVQISILMGLGIISGAVGIYKTTLFPILNRRETSLDVVVADTHRIAIWTNIEVDLIISAACIPLLRPVYRLVRKHVAIVLQDVRNRIGLGASASSTRGDSQQQHQQGIGEYRELPERTSSRCLHINPSRGRIWVEDDVEIQIRQGADLNDMGLSQTPKGPLR
jgi:hypothetical protein